MLVRSQSGDHSTDPENPQMTYPRERQSSTAVVVAGVAGTRRTYLVTADNTPLPPPKGTVQVLYTFVISGRTYFAQYDRYPGDGDLTADFNRMVTGSFKFSA
jgi:hypothetical protein